MRGNVISEPDPTPARELRHRLEEARRAGQLFWEAWDQAVLAVTTGLPSLDRNQWRCAFTATKDAWRLAFVKAGPRMAVSEDLATDAEFDQLSGDRVELIC